MTDADDRKGHRHRLRERFAADGGAAMPDYELLELLLFQMLPRRDTKPIAKHLIDRFGSLAAVLAADAENIAKIRDSGPAVASYLKAIHQAGRRMAREGLRTRKELGSWDMVLDYCRAELGHLTRESFHVLFLDQKNGLLTANEQSRGTVDQTSVYPREVVKRALELDAKALVMVQNHPSSDPTPSHADIEITRAVDAAAQALGIALHDHEIVTRNAYRSLRSDGLI